MLNSPLKGLKGATYIVMKTVKEGITIIPADGKYKRTVIWLHGLKSTA